MSVKHHELTAPLAIHPFAFVQSSDPALDPLNEVTDGKAWIDTSAGNALKIRVGGAWTTAIGGASQVSGAWRMVNEIWDDATTPLPGADLAFQAWHLVNTV